MNSILNANSLEYFTDNGQVFFIKDKYIHPFDDLSCSDATALRIDMESQPEVVTAIENVIPDPVEQLRQYAACRYGKLNNTPDFVNGKRFEIEATATDCRDTCRFNCKLCATKPTAIYGNPTKKEIEVAKLLPGRSDKEIAQVLQVSPNTVITHLSRLREKTGLHNRSGLMMWAMNINLF